MPGLKLFGPIVARDMIRLARRQRTYVLRAGLVVTFLPLILSAEAVPVLSWRPDRVDDGALAFEVFVSASFIQLVAIVLATPFFVATAIPREKRERTFDHLFTTDLTVQEIVIGKWSASAVALAHFLLAGLPVLAVSAILARVEAARLAGMALVMLATLVSVSALSLLVSVLRPTSKASVGKALGAIAIVLLLAPVLPWLVTRGADDFAQWGQVGGGIVVAAVRTVLWLSELAMTMEPFVAYTKLVDPQVRSYTLLAIALGYCLVHGFLAAVLLHASCALVRRSDRHGYRHRERKTLTVGRDGMLWKEWSFESATRRWWNQGIAARAFLVALPLVFLAPSLAGLAECFVSGPGMVSSVAVRFNAWLVPWSFLLMLAITIHRATTSIAGERLEKAWTLVLATPLGASAILRAKLLGSLKPLMIFLVLCLPIYAFNLVTATSVGLSYVSRPLLIVLLGWVCATMGLYTSLVFETSRAASAACFLVCFCSIALAPVPLWGIVCFLLSWLPGGWHTPWMYLVFLMLYFGGIGAFLYRRSAYIFDERFGRIPSEGRRRRCVWFADGIA